MILPWPLTTSIELAQVLRPGGHLRPDSALRTLRENGLAADPISFFPRSGRGARRRVVWYSSLMVDVVRLLRRGDQTAAVVHGAASRLFAHRSARALAEQLLGAGVEPDLALLDAATGGALTRLATLTASARQKYFAALGVDAYVGRVTDASEGVALVTEDGRTVSLPISPASSAWAAGALVSVDVEPLPGGAATAWVRAAFDSDADPNERVSGGPHILTPAERERLGHEVVSTA